MNNLNKIENLLKSFWDEGFNLGKENENISNNKYDEKRNEYIFNILNEITKITNCKLPAVYAGSFDPFTIGHYHIFKKAAKIFDVHIVFAKNPKKTRFTDLSQMVSQVSKLTSAKVVILEGFVADYCRENKIKHLVRGLRNTDDFNYEENIAKINKELYSSLDTLYLRADKYEIVSSTMVKAFSQEGKPVSKYLPKGICL